jgi:glutamine amidotransferase/cyclase
VSIGGDAVDAAEAFYARGGKGDGSTAIEEISRVYGRQAVVVRAALAEIFVVVVVVVVFGGGRFL